MSDALLELGYIFDVPTRTLKKPDSPNTLDIPAIIDGCVLSALGDLVFYGQNLIKVTIPQCVVTIGKHAFCKNNLRVIDLPTNLEVLSYGSFQSNRIEEIVIPRSTKIIEGYALADNPLETVVLPPSVELIDSYAFYNTSEDLILICEAGTVAHRYAEEHGHKFKIITQREMEEYYN